MASRAQIAAERRLARAALVGFGLPEAPFSALKLGSTATFLARPPLRAPLVLRLQPAGRMPLPAIEAELAMLAALRAQSSLRAPLPVASPAGALTVGVGGAEARIATLFEWQPGRQKRRLTPGDAALLGASLAALHRFSSSAPAARGLARWDFDADSFAGEAALFEQDGRATASAATAEAVSFEQHGREALDAADTLLVEQALAFVLRTLHAIGRDPRFYGLIHGDPNLSNWIFQPGGVALIDFEVCCYGYYLFDIGRMLHELEGVGQQGLAEAFYHGYADVRPLPPRHDPLILAGTLMSLLDGIFWACAIEPWMRREWGGVRWLQLLAALRRSWSQV